MDAQLVMGVDRGNGFRGLEQQQFLSPVQFFAQQQKEKRCAGQPQPVLFTERGDQAQDRADQKRGVLNMLEPVFAEIHAVNGVQSANADRRGGKQNSADRSHQTRAAKGRHAECRFHNGFMKARSVPNVIYEGLAGLPR